LVIEHYPHWFWYPSSTPPPAWATTVTDIFRDAQAEIDSSEVQGLGSDGVLHELSNGLHSLGFDVESGKSADDKILRPVLFGSHGTPRVSYEVDAVNDEKGIVVEIEAGRGWMSNAFYRDLVRSSLVLDARYLILAMMNEYRYKSGSKESINRSYDLARDQLDAIFASQRLVLPFEGVLLIGY
jgi:hypothetical protein|tara:strand:- start:126 stop:674 length:549 start_codon:yes stop_codon:yes gene_type:complete